MKTGLYYRYKEPQAKLVSVKPMGDKWRIENKAGDVMYMSTDEAISLMAQMNVVIKVSLKSPDIIKELENIRMDRETSPIKG